MAQKYQQNTTADPHGTEEANATSHAMLQMVLTETLGLTMHNAVSAQQNAQTLANAMVAASCTRILSSAKKQRASAGKENTTAGTGPVAKTTQAARPVK